MHEKLDLSIKLGLIGNALFIAFALVTYIYLHITIKPLEILAYLCEFGGFGALMASDYLMCRTVRMRTWLKIGYTAYIVMEAVIMFFELNSFLVRNFYDPYSLILAIVHSLITAVVCFGFLYLDPYKMKFEVVIIVCIGLILGGMFGNLLGIRLYFGVLVNAIAFTVLFAAIRYLVQREEIEIDCHGDQARVAEYSSILLLEPEDNDEKKKK